MSALKLFIPGPTEVRSSILQAQAKPMIGHRSEFMKELLAACLPGVRECFGTRGDVVILTGPSTTAMEGVCRSVVRPGQSAMHLTNGNFSSLWQSLSNSCGIQVKCAEKSWGDGWDEESTSQALRDRESVDAVFVTHCETSTGALSDLVGVTKAVRTLHPDALVCADVTSSACGTAIEFDAIDLDVAVGGVQKAWALPPGLALAALSTRAKARMKEVPHRGTTHDLFSTLAYQDEKAMTLTTPAIPVMQSLLQQIGDIHSSGGFAVRFEKHRQMQDLVLRWAEEHGFPVLARDGFRSPTVTSIACEGRFAIADLLAAYRTYGYFVGGGYGKTKTTHWRIGHMGDHTPEDIEVLLHATDRILEKIDSRVST